ncbi:MAG: dTMP kinase [Chloroflexi bacterium]|nr:dTMP kinase [Chloroflexota bacterium]
MGKLITFEGPEGSGKTTQSRLLQERLTAEGFQVLSTREPGGTAIGEQIRLVLHDLANEAMDPRAEALLYSAARAQHVAQVIRPALQAGKIVLSDRFAESTLAYQGYGHGLDLAMLKQITAFATGGVQADLVIYLDLDVSVGLERKWHDLQEGRGEWNRMDDQTLAFHERVRRGYLEMAAEEPERWLLLDATQPIETIHRHIYERMKTLL